MRVTAIPESEGDETAVAVGGIPVSNCALVRVGVGGVSMSVAGGDCVSQANCANSTIAKRVVVRRQAAFIVRYSQPMLVMTSKPVIPAKAGIQG